MDFSFGCFDYLRCNVGSWDFGFNEQHGGDGMKFFAVVLSAIGLIGCSSVEERDAHMQNQIRMVQVQKEADSKLAIAEANAKVALYEALADVARSNPSQASAVVVAMAVQGVGQESEAGDNRVVPLQPLQNEGLEYAKVFAGPAMNLVSGLGVAYINADVAKRQSDNAAAVQINDALQDSAIVSAVAGLGTAAANSTGITVGGDYLQASDSASISQDQISTVATTTTTTTETTQTSSTSTVTDSYNTVTYEGQEFSLPNLLAYLQGTGLAYNLTIGDTVYTIGDDGEAIEINCAEPQFSPAPPECVGG